MINYIIGDATNPIGDGFKVIAHVNNDIHRWGKGFVVALSNRWKEPEAHFRNHQSMKLGTVDFIPVEDDIVVANMIAQHTIWNDKHGNPPIRYSALHKALMAVNEYCVKNIATLHIPRIGCGLAGGKWEMVEEILKDTMSVNVFVYDLR